MKKGSSEGIRPVLPDDADKAYVNVLGTVWAEDPLQRPTFSHLLKQLEGLSPQRGDLMDNLVNMVISPQPPYILHTVWNPSNQDTLK